MYRQSPTRLDALPSYVIIIVYPSANQATRRATGDDKLLSCSPTAAVCVFIVPS